MFKNSLSRCFRGFKFYRSYSNYDGPSFQLTGKRKKVLEAGSKYVIAGGVGYAIADTLEHNRNDRNLGKSVLPLDDVRPPQYCEPKKLSRVIDQIKAVVGNNPENFTQSKAELDSHSDTFFSTHHASPEERPAIVIFPKSTEEVSQIVSICHDNRVPVVPFSGGTSLEGHFLPTRRSGTVVLDLSKYMNKVLKLNKTDLDVEVEAGVPWEDLNEMLGDAGLLFGCDPGPGAQIGGCVANSCSGTNAYRYGTMKENVVNLTVVLPDGTVIKTRKRPRKSSAGYNLNGLFTGNEGTLGIVTRATVKCHVKPKFQTVAVVPFKTIGDAAACSSSFTQQGIHLDAIELLDDNMMKVINSQAATFRNDWKEQPTLFLKIGGRNETIVQELINEVGNIAKAHNSTGFEFAKDDDEKLLLWEARKYALWSVIEAGKSMKGQNANVWTTDVALPISNFARVIMETKKEMNSSPLINATVGHAGDGNFHAFLIYKDDNERKICEDIVANMVRRAIDADGTCTGEHGVGIGKRQYILEELGQEPIDLMRKIKLAIDPHRIMNPDKIFKIDPRDNNDSHH